ncbi:hypothetical protein HNQ90_000932 [Algibacter amylolyticus]|nr:hypothetical protein [Algibacter amylolyticus]
MQRFFINKPKLAGMPALGIAADSPQPDKGGARTCSEKPDPWGSAQLLQI